MRLGDVLNGYEITTKPTNAGGGMSQWAFARKDGAEYFVKMFLAPKFPLDDGPGSPTAKANKRARALAFERRHLEIARRLDSREPGGGNLVVAREFFRVEATYVKIMDRVVAAELPPAHELTAHQVQVILRSLAFSLRLLHRQQVVHADIKPDNVMLERTGADLFVAKVIDFDEAYVVGEPPSPLDIVGDPSYYSPELLRYIKGDERLPADALTTASDMFSVGLFLVAFLTGSQVGFDRSVAKYPAEALLAGLPFDLGVTPDALVPLVTRMLSAVPAHRPTIQDLIDLLAEVPAEALVPRVAPPAPVSTKAPGVRPAAPGTAPTRPHRPGDTAPIPIVRPGPPAVAPAAAGGLRSTMGRRSAPTGETSR